MQTKIDELRDVVTAVAQRRHANAHDVQPVVEIFAKRLRPHHLLKIFVGRSNDPYIDPDGLGAADALNLTLLQHSQNFGLGRECHVSNFVEENGAAVAQLKFTQPLHRGTRERTFLVTEQFALNEVVGNRRAVYRDEGFRRSVAMLPNRARDQFFARAALARDHHRDIARGHLTDDLKHVLHRRRTPHDALAIVVRVDGGFVVADCPHIGVGLEGVFRQRQHFGRIKRLHHIIERPIFHRLDRGLSGAKGRHQHHQLLRID